MQGRADKLVNGGDGTPGRQAYDQLHRQRSQASSSASLCIHDKPGEQVSPATSLLPAISEDEDYQLAEGQGAALSFSSSQREQITSLQSLLHTALRQKRDLAAQLALLAGGATVTEAMLATQAKLQASQDTQRLLKKERDRAEAKKDKAEARLQQVQATLKHLHLSPLELEEAMLRNLWLARYWSLATRYGLFPAMAKQQSEMWEMVTPQGNKLSLLRKAVQRLWSGLQEGSKLASPPTASRELLPMQSHETSRCTTSEAAPSYRATAADAVEAERAMHDAQALRLTQAVLVAMVDSNRAGRAGPAATGAPSEPARLHPRSDLPVREEDSREQPATSSAADDLEEEAAFQTLWLAFFWCRAALAGIEGHIAGHKAAYWHHRACTPATALDLPALAAALRELHTLGIERQLWVSRQDR